MKRTTLNTYDKFVICPWCEYVHKDCWEWSDSENENPVKCEGCGEKFYYEKNIETTYYTHALSKEELEKLNKKDDKVKEGE
jgi:hypothetical protein